MENKFEKIGNIIYGAQRLNGVLAALLTWFVSKNYDDTQNFTDEPVGKSVAITFFENNLILEKSKPEYFRIVDAVKSLEAASVDIAGKGSTEIDACLAETRRLHFAIAQIIDELGFLGVPPALLREWGGRL